MNARKCLSSLARIAGAAILVMATVATARASDTFPTRTIRIFVNTGPGGLVDVTSRLVAERMGQILGQSVVVENRAGGDGIVGIVAAKGANPDGYTLLASSGNIAAQPAVKQNPGYDPSRDFIAIGPMMRTPYIAVVGRREPDTTLEEFIARAKKSPDKMSYASAGMGTTTHLAAALFLKQAGVDILHVPYKGNGPALPDVMAGRVNMIFEGYGSGIGKIQDGTLRALGVTSTERLPGLPNVPTIGEKAVPGFSFYGYVGLFAPAGTPEPAVAKIASALHEALASPEIQQRLREGGGDVVQMTPTQFDAFVKEDVVNTEKLARELKIEKK